MGIISDQDINEAWELVNNIKELTKKQKLEFVKGFEKGWRGY